MWDNYLWIYVLDRRRLFLWFPLPPFLPLFVSHSGKPLLVQSVQKTFVFSALFQRRGGAGKRINQTESWNFLTLFWVWMTFKCKKQRTSYCSVSSFQGIRLYFTARFWDTIPKAFFQATGMGMEGTCSIDRWVNHWSAVKWAIGYMGKKQRS